MLKKITTLFVVFAFLLSMEFDNNTQAASNNTSTQAASSCYDKYLFYGGWKRQTVSPYNVQINYKYTKNGSYDYTTRIGYAAQEWESTGSVFDFTKVSSGHNLAIASDDYGDTGWVGIAYYTRSPKDIQLNDWYHDNYSNYNYTAYERTAIHEFGHTHGLDHTSCVGEIMSNNSNRNILQVDLGPGDIAGIKDIY